MTDPHGDPCDAKAPTVFTPPPARNDASDPTVLSPTPPGPERVPQTAPAFDPLLGATLGGCRVEALLGRGGMGAAYRARHLGLERAVVVKILPPAFAGSPELRERFLREARATARLSHPNVVQVHDVGEQDGVVFYVMELVEGESLHELTQRRARLPCDEATRLVLDVARGLGEAHEAGIVHRDVKPANVLVSRRGQAKVLDFGLARDVAQEGLSSSGQMLGTPHYMAPEQAEGQADARSDLYSLGITYFRLLTGELPFEGSSAMNVIRKHFEEPPPLLRTRLPDAPASVEALISRLLEKEPQRRFQTAAETARALEAVLRELGGGAPAPPLTPPPPAAPARPRRAWALVVAVAPVAVALGVVAARWGRAEPPRAGVATETAAPATSTVTEPPHPATEQPAPPPAPTEPVVAPPAPELALEPPSGGLTASRDVRLVGRLTEAEGLTVLVDGEAAPLVGGRFEVTRAGLADGEHALAIEVRRDGRPVARATWHVRVDATPPALSWAALPRALRLDDAGPEPRLELSVAVAGEAGPVEVRAGVVAQGAEELPLTAGEGGAWTGSPSLWAGPGRVWVGRVPLRARASDEAGNTAELAAEVVVVPRGMVLVEPGQAPAFFMDRDEVTVRALGRYLAATGRPAPRRWNPGAPAELPAQHVSCNLAEAYAAWLGRRLPTEREWELAAAWRDGRLRRFPWGDEERAVVDANVGRRDRGAPRPAGASADDVGPWGCRDMAGNLSEWVVAGEERRHKGGNYSVRQLVGAAADAPGTPKDPALEFEHVGFRCARGLALGEEVEP